jgi:hypothetical protein
MIETTEEQKRETRESHERWLRKNKIIFMGWNVLSVKITDGERALLWRSYSPSQRKGIMGLGVFQDWKRRNGLY